MSFNDLGYFVAKGKERCGVNGVPSRKGKEEVTYIRNTCRFVILPRTILGHRFVYDYQLSDL